MKKAMGSLRFKKGKQVASLAVLAVLPLAVIAILAFVVPKASPVLAAACQSPSSDFGRATQKVSVTTDDTYRVWSRLNTPNQADNSYFLQVDDNQCFVVGDLEGLASGRWAWLDYQNGNVGSKVDVQLDAGEHTLTMIGREPNVKIDSVLLSADTSCVPEDEGKNCTDTNDTTAPIVELTSPQDGAAVTGIVEMTAEAADDEGGSGMQKVEFYVDGSLQAVDESEPYSASWDASDEPDDTYTLRAKAYDAAGNSSGNAVQVSVQNNTPEPDTQAPSAPTDVTAAAPTYEQVEVSWQASTDNVDVTSYRIFRNGTPLSDTSSNQTNYTDNTTAPGTEYRYRVVAFDAVGNESEPSNTATVTTPEPEVQDVAPPSAPTNVRTEPLSQSQINLYWQASVDNIGVTAYDVYRAEGNDEATKISTVTTTSLGDTNLAAGTEYRYHVIARDAADNSSERSQTVSGQTFADNTPPPEEDSEENDAGNGNQGGLASVLCRFFGVCRGSSVTDQSGVIVGNVGADIRGVKVRVFIDGKQKIYTTNAQGNYRIEGLRTGKYPLIFTHPRYFLNGAWVQVRSGETATKNIKLLSNDIRSLINSFWNRR